MWVTGVDIAWSHSDVDSQDEKYDASKVESGLSEIKGELGIVEGTVPYLYVNG